MSNQQLALPAPYGYNDGYHVTLTAKDGFDEPGAIQAVMSFGCPRKVADRAISCLRHSNRYDCVMSPHAWGDGQDRGLRSRLQAVGCDIELRAGPNYNDPGQPARYARQAEQRRYHNREGGQPAARQAQNLPRRFDPIADILEIDTHNRIDRILSYFESEARRYRK